jgi:hypothetical protein
MRGKAASAVAVLGKKMGEFVKQGAFDLLMRDLTKGGIQPDFPT